MHSRLTDNAPQLVLILLIQFEFHLLATNMRKLPGLFGVVAVMLLGTIAATSLAKPVTSRHACEADCTADVTLPSPVQQVPLRDSQGIGSTARRLFKTATFLVKVTGGGRSKTVSTSTLQCDAACATRDLGCAAKGRLPTLDEWRKLRGNRRDYTTVVGGVGFYFDAVCK